MKDTKVLNMKPLELILNRIENDLEVIQEQLPSSLDSQDLAVPINTNTVDAVPVNNENNFKGIEPDFSNDPNSGLQDLGLLLYQKGGVL